MEKFSNRLIKVSKLATLCEKQILRIKYHCNKMERMDVDSEANLNLAPSCSHHPKCRALASNTSIMAGPGTTPSVTASLHPLVILNISEHWTRIRAQAGETCQVFGALIGKQKGRNIEVMNSFELRVDRVGADVVINREYYQTKEQQFKQVFVDNEKLANKFFIYSSY